LSANPESKNTDHGNQGLGLCSWVPGLALKGHPGTTAEFFCILLIEYRHPTAWSREDIMEPHSADFAERLVAGMSDAIVYADAEGVIRVWNRGATRIFGFAEAEALGRSLDIIIPENLRERHWQGYRATMRTGQSRYGDGQILSVPAVRKDGARVSVEFTIVPFTDKTGQMIGIAAIMRDATARFEELRALRRQLALHSAANP